MQTIKYDFDTQKQINPEEEKWDKKMDQTHLSSNPFSESLKRFKRRIKGIQRILRTLYT